MAAGQVTVGQLAFPNSRKLSGGVTVAVRPEDVILYGEEGQGLGGTIKQIMILGHYAEVSVDLQEHGTIKAFQPRDQVKDLQQGQQLKVNFAKALAYQEV